MAVLQITCSPAKVDKGGVYSVPCFKDDKEFLINESIRTNLSQKELLKRAVEALKKAPRIPNALPVKL